MTTRDRLVIRSEEPLEGLSPDPSWGERPVAVAVPGMGAYRLLSPHLALWRRPALVVHLPATTAGARDARILASLGVATCLEFTSQEPDWEALGDLVTWVALSRLPHAPVHPFTFVVDGFDPARPLPWEHLGLDAPPAAVSAAHGLEPWRSHFLKPSPCAACEGFRVCLGGLAAAAAPDGRPGPDAPCRPLALEWLSVADEARALRRTRTGGPPWLP